LMSSMGTDRFTIQGQNKVLHTPRHLPKPDKHWADNFVWKGYSKTNAFGIVEHTTNPKAWAERILKHTNPTPAYVRWSPPSKHPTAAPHSPTPAPTMDSNMVLFLHLTIAGARWQHKALHKHTRLLRRGLLQYLNTNAKCTLFAGCGPFKFRPSALQVVRIQPWSLAKDGWVSDSGRVDHVTVGVSRLQ
jgi:hypothetical protein